MDRYYGTVNVSNIEEVTERLRELLGGKYFTSVHCYEYKDYEPEVRVHQCLEGGRESKSPGDPANITLIHHHEKKDAPPDARPHSQVVICDTYGVGGFSTTQVDAGYDPEFNSPYIRFSYNQVTITDRAPNGLKYYAVYAVEGDIKGSPK